MTRDSCSDLESAGSDLSPGRVQCYRGEAGCGQDCWAVGSPGRERHSLLQTRRIFTNGHLGDLVIDIVHVLTHQRPDLHGGMKEVLAGPQTVSS